MRKLKRTFSRERVGERAKFGLNSTKTLLEAVCKALTPTLSREINPFIFYF
jgi:hypothetical protein